MNDKQRKVFVAILANIGAAASAITFVRSGIVPNIPAAVLLSFAAGTGGYFAFTRLGTWLMRVQKQHSYGRPGQAVYAFGKLPPQEAVHAGGKGRALAQLFQAGFPVPDGCILLPAAFDGDELSAAGWEMLRGELARLRAGKPIAFAVRSSAHSEDSAQASFAGEFESVLNVRTNDEIRTAIRTVRASMRNERVQAYREARRIETAGQEIAVVIQRLVRADISGVLFTADPLDGNLMRMVGNFVHGMGDALVSGQVSASEFSFERTAGVYHGPAALEKVAKSLHRHAHDIENETGCPQDIEWAVAGDRLAILQARPITTLNGHDPVTAEWNDTRKGNFLWSATNLMEACPDVLTPFTISLRPYMDTRGGPSLTVKGHPLNGIIGGRFYANISVQVSAFAPMFKGDAHRAYREMSGWWGQIPAEMEIPLLPLTRQEWQQTVLPGLWRTMRQFARYRRLAPAYLARNRQNCARLREKIAQAGDGAQLVRLWHDEIVPGYRDALLHIVAAGSDAQVRLEQELKTLVGAEDANALLSNLGGLSSRLESVGPVAGLGLVLRGEMSRQAYLDAYGHRGVNEGECAWPRPMEDPAWLDHQLAEWSRTPVDVNALLERQRDAYQAAWGRFCALYPRKVKSMQKRLEKTARAASLREAVRSEGTRGMTVLRAFALRAGEMLEVGEDIFFLGIEEALAGLRGDTSACGHIPARKETYDRYRALPPYPALICGRFDPFAWATDANRRSDFFDSRAASAHAPIAAHAYIIQGAAGALGVVEGIVRKLERLEDGGQFEAGEVLVTTMTNIGWTPLFPRAAAIVTDLGAPLSHAAIVARELGIPAVVGCGDATARLRTGDRVRVDGGRGLVEVLGNKA
ncbi:MAG: PEP/pyruvate-binding domain-containing protein [Chloroflexota bacterium]